MRSNDKSVAAASARSCGVCLDVADDDDEDGVIKASEWRMSHNVVNKREFLISQSRVTRSAVCRRVFKRLDRRCRRPLLDTGAISEDDGPTAAAVENGVVEEEAAAKVRDGVEVGSEDVCIGGEGFDMRKEAGMWSVDGGWSCLAHV